MAALALSLAGTVAPARAQGACPAHRYLGNYPNEREFDWSTEAQGIAHGSGNWFFTQKNRILKLPVRSDLGLALTDQPVGWQGLEGFPTEMALKGYDHYGDPHVYGGFLFVPVETSDRRAAIAAFQTSNLGFVDFVEVTEFQERAAWLAINRGQRLLYSSDGTVSGEKSLLRYRIDLAPLVDDRVPRARKLDRALDANPNVPGLTLHSKFGLSRPDGEQVRLFTMQGGVFSPRGDLYLMSSPGLFLDLGGITLWNPAGRLIDRSENASGLGGFKYEFHAGFSKFEEPEGMDWWNRSVAPASPRVRGQLHAILLDNDANGDDLYVKHYQVDYRCR